MEPQVMEEFPTLDDLANRPAWMERGACRGAGADLFFPERGASTRQAKELCSSFPVQAECLSYAVDATEGVAGIWGGTSERERRRGRRAVA
ncbi:MAG: WhiB family transcriptional regulator [Acidimicrobiales bacterium]